MKKIYAMKNLVKGLMLAAFMAVGTTTVSAQATNGTGTNGTTYTPAAASDFWMGEAVKAGEFYLYNVGTGIFATDNTPSEKDITKAATWTTTEHSPLLGGKTYSFTSGSNKIYMEYVAFKGWTTEISSSKSATDFTLATGKTTEKGSVYALSNSVAKMGTHYFNVEGTSYSAAANQSNLNDWLLISADQKDSYDEYTKLFNTADTLRNSTRFGKINDVEGTNKVVKQLEAALNATAKSNYISFTEENGGKAQLEAAINATEDFIKANTTITGINGVNADDAQVSAIYDVNGVQKSQMTKGINIVKMSNGKVKKVLVK